MNKVLQKPSQARDSRASHAYAYEFDWDGFKDGVQGLWDDVKSGAVGVSQSLGSGRLEMKLTSPVSVTQDGDTTRVRVSTPVGYVEYAQGPVASRSYPRIVGGAMPPSYAPIPLVP